MKTKLLCLAISCLLLLALVPVCAAEEMITITKLPVSVTYNGEPILFPDAAPLVQNGRTLVPVRPIMERAKLTVDFDPNTRTVVAGQDALSIKMLLDHTTAEITRGNEQETVTLEEPARIIDGRTYVPVRFIAESLGIKVNWNPYAQEVVLINTAEWKQEIASKSRYFNQLLDQPLWGNVPQAGNAVTNLSMSYASKNMPDNNGALKDWAAELSLSATETRVFDGKKAGAYVSIQSDLSQLTEIDPDFMDMLFTKTDASLVAKLAKQHAIDVDIVRDSEHAHYAKSIGLASLLQDMGQAALAAPLEKDYLKMQPSEILSLLLPGFDWSSSADLLLTAETPWELLKNGIEKDDMLYTGSVKLIDSLLHLYVKLFDNQQFTLSKHWDGTYLWKYNPDQVNFKETILEIAQLMKAITGASQDDILQQKREALLKHADMMMTITMTLKEKDGSPIKTEATMTFTLKEQPVPSFEKATRQLQLEIKTGSSVRDFESRRDKRVIIPKNAVPFSTIHADTLP